MCVLGTHQLLGSVMIGLIFFFLFSLHEKIHNDVLRFVELDCFYRQRDDEGAYHLPLPYPNEAS